jgi:hypothetical protein
LSRAEANLEKAGIKAAFSIKMIAEWEDVTIGKSSAGRRRRKLSSLGGLHHRRIADAFALKTERWRAGLGSIGWPQTSMVSAFDDLECATRGAAAVALFRQR